jgi:putative nucleotidyltransferase with HDIG domain
MAGHVSLKKLILKTGDLPSMPFVAAKVMQIVGDANSTVAQLQTVIQDDQGLASRILKVANSALYARSRQITTITDAIVMLGFNNIRSLAVTSATRNLYLKRGKVLGLKDKLLWEHSVAAALSGRMVAERVDLKVADEAFLWGLLHDIGKLVILQKLPDEFDRIVEAVYNQGRSFVDAEREHLGFDHTEVGAMIIKKWKLSERFENAILNHHNLDESKGQIDPWVRYIDLANSMCKKLGFGFVKREDMDLTEDPSAVALGITPDRMELILNVAREKIREEMELFT